MEDGSGLVGSFRKAGLAALKPKAAGNLVEDKAALPGQKSDKITVTTKGLTTKYIIQDSIVERRNAREFITVKPYVRIAATLSTVKPENTTRSSLQPFDLMRKEARLDVKTTLQGRRRQTASIIRASRSSEWLALPAE